MQIHTSAVTEVTPVQHQQPYGLQGLEEKDQSVNQLFNYTAVCRTAPATPSLLKNGKTFDIVQSLGPPPYFGHSTINKKIVRLKIHIRTC